MQTKTQDMPLLAQGSAAGRPDRGALSTSATAGLFGAGLLWSYWTTLEQLAERWWIDPQYSYGFLVPLFALIILWLKKPAELTWRPSAWGLVLLALSMLPRWFAARMDLTHVDGACM